jgi:propanol-preferring alcohol dehydrogenase
MKAMALENVGGPLHEWDVPIPTPGHYDVLIRVFACGVCRTDLHIHDGEISPPQLPLILGHEVVGTAVSTGKLVHGIEEGQRVGVPWLGHTCGVCVSCLEGRENLCDRATFTGYHNNGGYAEYIVADYRYCFPIPENVSDKEAAPLLCSGLIGYRALCSTGLAKERKEKEEPRRIGFYGFGASAHILTQLISKQRKSVYAFTRPGDEAGQEFAKRAGAVWAGGSDDLPNSPLDAAIIFAPIGEMIPSALRAIRKGGVVVCAGIHMSKIPSFSYDLLWGERSIRSVANLTRQDGMDFFSLIRKRKLQIEVTPFPLLEANTALDQLRSGQIKGAAVLII